MGNLTVGSDDRRSKKSKGGDFAAYGVRGQFSTLADGSKESLVLPSAPRPGAVPVKKNRGIKVQVNIDVESQERKDRGPRKVWPVEDPRPDPSIE
jgi:hypothetical protein